jgi:predicted nucleic acid-binding protein
VIVLDASAVIEWLLGLKGREAVEQRVADPGTVLNAPHLISIEVAQVVRRFEAAGAIDARRASEAIEDLSDLDIVHHEHEPLLPLMWRLRSNLTAYDAAYVALGLALDAPLLTLDARLARAPHGAAIDLIT